MSAMFSWLVVWVAEVMNKFKMQEDGRTAYGAITKTTHSSGDRIRGIYSLAAGTGEANS